MKVVTQHLVCVNIYKTNMDYDTELHEEDYGCCGYEVDDPHCQVYCVMCGSRVCAFTALDHYGRCINCDMWNYFETKELVKYTRNL